jgi:hydrogenase maturation factor
MWLAKRLILERGTHESTLTNVFHKISKVNPDSTTFILFGTTAMQAKVAFVNRWTLRWQVSR